MEYHNSNNKLVHSPIQLSTGTLEKTYETISAAIAQSVKSDGAIHTTDRELEKIITNAIKKEELRHSKIQKELDDTDKMDTYKLYGDLLMINGHLQVQYESSIDLPNLLDESGNTDMMLTIPLNPQLNIIENGQAYYKLYTKLKNRMISGRYQLDSSTTKLMY